MQAIQTLLMGAFSSLVLLTVLILLGQALAEELTIYDKDWGVKGHIEGGRVMTGTKGRKRKLRMAEFHEPGGNRNLRRQFSA